MIKGDNKMELNYFRNKLFDLLNDNEGIEIADLNADERNNLFAVRTEEGNVFEIVCQQAAGKENKWTTENWPFIMGVGLKKNLRPRFSVGIKLPWNASKGSVSS